MYGQLVMLMRHGSCAHAAIAWAWLMRHGHGLIRYSIAVDTDIYRAWGSRTFVIRFTEHTFLNIMSFGYSSFMSCSTPSAPGSLTSVCGSCYVPIVY